MTVTINDDRNVTLIDKIKDSVVPRILLIVTDKDSLNANTESNLKSDLEGYFGALVDVAQSDADIDSGNWDITRYDLIIVCNGVTPSDVNNLKSVEVPVISLDEDVSITALNMAATGGAATTETQSNVTDITHQITSEALRGIDPTSIATGNKSVYSTASTIDFVTTLGSGGVSIAEDTGTATEEHIALYEEDATLQDSTLAEEIRIHFGYYQFNQLTATGKALFRNIVEYAIFGGFRYEVKVETDIEWLKTAFGSEFDGSPDLYDTIVTGYDSSAIASNRDGSDMERLEWIIAALAAGGTLDNNQNFGFRFGGFLPQGQELGVAFYCDTDVSSSGAGTSWTAAVKTIAELDALVTANNGDYGFVAQGTYDENAGVNGVSMTKANSHYIAMSRGLTQVVNSNGSAVTVFAVSGVACECVDFLIAETTATVEGIVVSNTGCFIHDCHFNGSMENGIRCTASSCYFYDNYFRNIANDAIELGAGSQFNHVFNNRIYGSGDNGIHMSTDDSDGNFIYDNKINGLGGSTDYGITVTLGDRNHIDWNDMGELGTAPVFDSGSNNFWGPNNSADSLSGSYNRTVGNGTSLITSNVTDVDLWGSGKYELQWDLSTLVTAAEGGNVDCVFYSKPDGSNYIRRGSDRMVIGTDNDHPSVEKAAVGGDSELQEGLQCSSAVTANRLIYYRIVKIS